MDLYRQALRPLLFRLESEDAHRLAGIALRWPKLWRLLASGDVDDPHLAVDIGSLRLTNSVGLAAGFDKNAEFVPSLQHFGFGFLVAGSIMKQVRRGAPRPRVERIAQMEAISTCIGLPSKGRGRILENLRRFNHRRVPLVANVQGTSLEEVYENFVEVQPHADAMELPLDCPTTSDTDGNRDFSGLLDMLRRIGQIKDRPLIVKVPIYFRVERRDLLPILLGTCLEINVDGIVVGGTRSIPNPRLSAGRGSLAGRPVLANTLAILREVSQGLGGRAALLGTGGIFTGRDVFEAMRAGASAVELYSAFVYRGWSTPRLINRELLEILRAEGIPSVRSLIEQVGAAPVACR